MDKNKWDQSGMKLVSQTGDLVVYFCFTEHIKKYFSMHSNINDRTVLNELDTGCYIQTFENMQ